MSDRHPNVLLVVMDTARRDVFTPYGASPDATPSTAQLAARGTAFPRAIAAANWTLPSHVSMLTGLLPRTAGLSHPPKHASTADVLRTHERRWLPSVLARAGYRTRGASANVWISKRNGFDMGFDDWTDVADRRVRRMHDERLKSRAKWYVQAWQAQVDDGVFEVERHVAQWIEERDDRPLFGFVNLIECHSPYLPPKPYSDVGAVQRLRAARDAREFGSMHGVWRCCSTGVTPPARSLDRMRHLYGRSVRMMDDFLGRILERLDSARILDETIVIVTSDHGENFGESGLIGHAASLDDRLIGVPLVIAGPGAPAIDGVWSQARLPSLVTTAAGIADAPWGTEDGAPAVAVAQYDTGFDADFRAQFEAWGAPEDRLRRFFEPGTAATDGRNKLVVVGEDEALFDLERDPTEMSPVLPDEGDEGVVAVLRRAIADSARDAWTPNVASATPPPDENETREIEERMKLLGYM